jgi:uncharacterized protein (UPF0332 family)
MKPEAADYLEKARESIDEARAIYGIGLASVAARSAYYATFHAAQALIFSQTGKVAKTHSGVRSEFNRLARGNEHISPELRAFLAKAYAYKEIDDYGTEKKSVITMAMAKSAVDIAEGFVACIEAALTGP